MRLHQDELPRSYAVAVVSKPYWDSVDASRYVPACL